MWDQNQRNSFAKNYVLTAKLYDKEISIELATMVVDDLQDLDFQKCLTGLEVFRRDKNNKFWPKPSDIRAIVNPQIDKRILAINLARKADQLVAKKGWAWDLGVYINGVPFYEGKDGVYYETFKEALISEGGEILWHAIASKGGWLSTRESANNMEEQGFISQMRDQIHSSLVLAEQGVDLAKIEMPSKDKPMQITENNTLNNLLGSSRSLEK